MRNRTWLLLVLYGFLLVSAVSAALKNTRPKFKIATTWTTPSSTTDKSQADNETVESENDDGSKIEVTSIAGDLNATTGHTLTGIPQIDYIWDPNLPRELNGYNLSDYPFYNRIPIEEIDFKCDGLHDGFYASVPLKCQVYHHCLYGTRYDFLCANFTAFDQKTFICHFVSEVDCANSKKYWHRNDALYKAATTTTIAPPTTTTTMRTTTSQAPPQPFPQGPRSVSRRRRPFRRRPAYDYYDLEYYDDDYDRPRSRGSGYDRREEYDYDDRQYTRRDNRERDRDQYHFRDHDRDYRDKDQTRPREYTSERSAVKDDQDAAVMRPRDRFPTRINRRDPLRQEPQGDVERGNDGRNYQDQRYDRGFVRDDYEEPETSAPSNEGGLVKPSAPISSVFSRPRAPPKIRRPVPLSEQERFAYKATTPQPIIGMISKAEESHRRPTEVAPAREQDYYNDQLEDVRPRRPLRRRPYRERERFAYDHPRDMRDRPYRTRFREDEEEMRPRKYPERPRDRDRYYERNRDRALLDHEKDSVPERIVPEREREHRPTLGRPPSREKENDRPLAQLPNIRDTLEDSEDVSNKAIHPTSKDSDFTTSKTVQNNNNHDDNDNDNDNDNRSVKNNEKETESRGVDEEYLPDDEYYDETEYSSSPSSPSSSAPPKAAVRIIKRPFLPSRGGNPNPRGLSTVGIKAPEPNKKYNTSVKSEAKITDSNKEYSRGPDKVAESYTSRSQEPKVYDAYKAIGNDKHHKKQEFDQQLRRPESSNNNKEFETNLHTNSGSGSDKWRIHEDKSEIKPSIPWNGEELRRRPQALPNRGGNRHSVIDNSSYTNYQHSYANEQSRKEITGPSSLVTKQKINEVPHRLLDIPESEYDVALNEALTPAFNQDSSLPSGFVLPYNQHNRHVNREPALEPSENNYRVSRPYNTQPDQSQQHHQHHQHQKSFVPSTQFFPTTRVANNDESRGSIQYFKTPEVVHIAGSGYNRQSGRNSWHDYTG